jgi:dUTP pyrophosphatase
MIDLKIFLQPGAKMPVYSTEGAAGLDFFAQEAVDNGGVVSYSTGVHMEIPEGHVLLLFPRSSVYKTGLTLANCVGVIDSDYRGEIIFNFRWVGDKEDSLYSIGHKIGQGVIFEIPKVNLLQVGALDELSKTERGEGRFGSTGT